MNVACTARRWPECCGPSSITISIWINGSMSMRLILCWGLLIANVRNAEWFHMLNSDIISMPDKWEYPWYAAWDLAFHTLALSIR